MEEINEYATRWQQLKENEDSKNKLFEVMLLVVSLLAFLLSLSGLDWSITKGSRGQRSAGA